MGRGSISLLPQTPLAHPFSERCSPNSRRIRARLETLNPAHFASSSYDGFSNFYAPAFFAHVRSVFDVYGSWVKYARKHVAVASAAAAQCVRKLGFVRVGEHACGERTISFYTPLGPSRAFCGARRALRPRIWVTTETLGLWEAASTCRNDEHMILV